MGERHETGTTWEKVEKMIEKNPEEMVSWWKVNIQKKFNKIYHHMVFKFETAGVVLFVWGISVAAIIDIFHLSAIVVQLATAPFIHYIKYKAYHGWVFKPITINKFSNTLKDEMKWLEESDYARFEDILNTMVKRKVFK